MTSGWTLDADSADARYAGGILAVWRSIPRFLRTRLAISVALAEREVDAISRLGAIRGLGLDRQTLSVGRACDAELWSTSVVCIRSLWGGLGGMYGGANSVSALALPSAPEPPLEAP